MADFLGMHFKICFTSGKKILGIVNEHVSSFNADPPQILELMPNAFPAVFLAINCGSRCLNPTYFLVPILLHWLGLGL